MTTPQDDPLAVLEPLLADREVTEILIDGYDRVYVEKHGQFVDVDSPFRDNAHLLEVINVIFERLGRTVNESNPIGDARLPDGSRVNAVIPPIALTGPTVTMRKFSKEPLTLEDVLRFGSIGENQARFLQACVKAHLNIAVTGGTGSGKTTVLNIVAGMADPDERMVVVENATEMRLPQKRVVRLESRPPNLEGRGEISIRDLVINSMRMRPDRIIVGEVRAAEAIEILQAMNTGHDGSMFSIHATSPRDALARLEVMATMAGLDIPVLAIREQIANAVQIITYQERLSDGTRKVMKVSEVLGMRGQAIELQDLFEFRQTGVDENGKIKGHFTATGAVPSFLSRMRSMGVELPLDLFTPS